jgi:integrase
VRVQAFTKLRARPPGQMRAPTSAPATAVPNAYFNAAADITPTFSEFIAERYMPFALATKRSGACEEILFRNHLLPAFGHVRLNEISRASVSWLIQEKIKEGYKPGTINRILANLKTALSKAIEWEIGGLDKNVARQVKALRDPPHLDRFLSEKEAERLLGAIRKSQSPMLRFIIPFLLFTGGRKREALDARWEHVNLDLRLWTIPLSKSGKPRHVPLSDQTVEILKSVGAFASIVLSSPCPWVFPNPLTTKPYTSIFHPWDLCRRSVGLPEVRIHDLRHSFASALVNRGMTLFDVKEALGHSNIATTQRYAHLSPERLRNAVQQAEEFYGAALKANAP